MVILSGAKTRKVQVKTASRAVKANLLAPDDAQVICRDPDGGGRGGDDAEVR